jgi:hypothetical protein
MGSLLLMGANQITILCRLLVVREQMTPMITRIKSANNTVCRAVLWTHLAFDHVYRSQGTYGVKE